MGWSYLELSLSLSPILRVKVISIITWSSIIQEHDQDRGLFARPLDLRLPYRHLQLLHWSRHSPHQPGQQEGRMIIFHPLHHHADEEEWWDDWSLHPLVHQMDEGGAINTKLIYPLATAVVFHLAWLLVKGVFDDLKNGSGDRRVGGLSLS